MSAAAAYRELAACYRRQQALLAEPDYSPTRLGELLAESERLLEALPPSTVVAADPEAVAAAQQAADLQAAVGEMLRAQHRELGRGAAAIGRQGRHLRAYASEGSAGEGSRAQYLDRRQ